MKAVPISIYLNFNVLESKSQYTWMLIFVKKLGLVKKKWDLKGRLAIYADQHKDCEKIYNVTEKKLAHTTEEKKLKLIQLCQKM